MKDQGKISELNKSSHRHQSSNTVGWISEPYSPQSGVLAADDGDAFVGRVRSGKKVPKIPSKPATSQVPGIATSYSSGFAPQPAKTPPVNTQVPEKSPPPPPKMRKPRESKPDPFNGPLNGFAIGI